MRPRVMQSAGWFWGATVKRPMRALLIATCVLSAGTVGSAASGTPQFVRIVCGTLTVFVLPGFALTSTVRPTRALSPAERLLASVGLSVAISTSAAVLLAALTIGLTRSSFAVLMGALTVVLVMVAGARLSSEMVGDNREAQER
jgi:uncharacterized membrane protein